jgi:hypothetical protein
MKLALPGSRKWDVRERRDWFQWLRESNRNCEVSAYAIHVPTSHFYFYEISLAVLYLLLP